MFPKLSPSTWIALALAAVAIGLTITAIVVAYPTPWRVITSPALFTGLLIWAWFHARSNPTTDLVDGLLVYALIALLGWADVAFAGSLVH